MESSHPTEYIYNKYEIEEARQKIADFAKKEERGEVPTGNFLNFEPAGKEPFHFNAGELSDEDLIIWLKIQNDSMTDTEFIEFNNGAHTNTKKAKSQQAFYAFLRNQYQWEKTRAMLKDAKK